MALVAPGVARYTINGSLLGRPTACIVDVAMAAGGSLPPDRADLVEATAQLLIDAYAETVLTGQNSLFTFQSVSWVDLNSEDGSTGVATQTEDVTLPENGSVSGEALPASVAALVTKTGTSARGRRRGRMFIPGISEANTSGNMLLVNYINAMQPLFDSFLASITLGDPTTGDSWRRMCVVHTSNAGQTYEGRSFVTGLSLEQQVASQRRRNRG